MTFVTKQHKNDNYYISMSYEGNLIIVQVCPLIKSDYCTCGYPIKKMTYGVHERKNALATYNRYIKNYN